MLPRGAAAVVCRPHTAQCADEVLVDPSLYGIHLPVVMFMEYSEFECSVSVATPAGLLSARVSMVCIPVTSPALFVCRIAPMRSCTEHSIVAEYGGARGLWMGMCRQAGSKGTQ